MLIWNSSYLVSLLTFILIFYCDTSHSKNQWTVQIDGGDSVAELVARSFGLVNKGKIPHLHNKYIFEAEENRRQKREADFRYHVIEKRLNSHPEISWVLRSVEIQREKRDFRSTKDSTPLIRTKRFEAADSSERFVFPTSEQYATTKFTRQHVDNFSPNYISNGSSARLFRDPSWPQQWYLHGMNSPSGFSNVDLRVIPTWRKNITGRGVKVTIIDDGLEWNHPDIKGNYDPKCSYDFNNEKPDPTPDYSTEDSKHGTRCAGEIGMIANNSYCGVGIAFNAGVGGLKILAGPVFDVIEARSLTHNLDYIDIYSSSWGPKDNGMTMEGPGPLTKEAMLTGVTEGRGGKGTIYVWASGNGGFFHDNCNCDGYCNSIYTISVSSATERLQHPLYSEECSATLSTTYSSGSVVTDRYKMISIDTGGKCTNSFTGTSASAPVAAAILALALEANPNLTWRDMQHAIVWTGQYAPLSHNKGWKKNGIGLFYHHNFGFGLFNADKLTDIVNQRFWKTVPPKSEVLIPFDVCNDQVLSALRDVQCFTEVNRKNNDQVNYLEHVQLMVNLSYSYRGALSIWLQSPSGTMSRLLSQRFLDRTDVGIDNWKFMSVHFWGENPKGTWKVIIEDLTRNVTNVGEVSSVDLILHGTYEMPDYRKINGGMKIYNSQQNSLNQEIVQEESFFTEKLLDMLQNKLSRFHSNHKTGLHRVRPEVDFLLSDNPDLYT